MAKHRLGQADGGQWGGPDLVNGIMNGTEDSLSRSDAEQSDSTTELQRTTDD